MGVAIMAPTPQIHGEMANSFQLKTIKNIQEILQEERRKNWTEGRGGTGGRAGLQRQEGGQPLNAPSWLFSELLLV